MPERPVDYIAGQFAELTVPHADVDKRSNKRWFTLASNPTDPHIAITTRFGQTNTRSSFKQALLKLQPGDVVQLSEPMGDFVLPLNDTIPLVWIAGGIGITPMRSMATWLAQSTDTREITLFHGIRRADDAIFAGAMRSAQIPVTTILANDRLYTGLIQQVVDIHKTSSNNNASATLFYISGSENMVQTVRQGLLNHGIVNYQIIVDSFLGY